MNKQANTKNKSTSKGLIVLLVIIAVTLILASLSNSNNNQGKTNNFWSKITTNKYIAVLHIEGTIGNKTEYYDQEWFLNTIEDLINDNNNKGIIIAINSPGGSVYESDELYLKLMHYKQITGRPIVAYFEQLAASGGYYISCAADYICANRNTLTGSIGVIAGESYDLSKLFEKYGINYNIFTAGKNKAMLGIATPVTNEQRKIMEEIANECYEQFCSIVSTSRHITLNDTKKIADGRIYTAIQAKNNGLIDEICSIDGAYNLIEKILTLSKKEIKYIWYEPEEKSSFFKNLLNSVSAATNTQTKLSSEIQEITKTLQKTTWVPENISYPAYYWKQ